MQYDCFLDTITENQREIINFLNDEFLSYPEVSTKMRFRIPFYDHGTWFCYLNPVKPDAVELCFLNGLELSNAHGLLDGKKRKMVAGITITSLKKMPLDAILESFFESIALIKPKN